MAALESAKVRRADRVDVIQLVTQTTLKAIA